MRFLSALLLAAGLLFAPQADAGLSANRHIQALIGDAIGTFVEPPYAAVGIDYDASTDYGLRGGGLTGAVDGKTYTFSVWFRIDGAQGQVEFLHSTGNAHSVLSFSSDIPGAFSENDGGTGILHALATTALSPGATWHHYIISVDMADTGKRAIYLDGVNEENWITYTNDDIDFTVAEWAIGGAVDGGQLWNGCLADMWFNDTYIDLDNASNRLLWRDGDGNPTDLGVDGSTPISAVPLIYISGANSGDLLNNDGDGGGFTDQGSVVVCSTSPSD